MRAAASAAAATCHQPPLQPPPPPRGSMLLSTPLPLPAPRRAVASARTAISCRFLNPRSEHLSNSARFWSQVSDLRTVGTKIKGLAASLGKHVDNGDGR